MCPPGADAEQPSTGSTSTYEPSYYGGVAARLKQDEPGAVAGEKLFARPRLSAEQARLFLQQKRDKVGATNIDTDNARQAAAAAATVAAKADKEKSRAAGARLFRAIHPEMTPEQALDAADADPAVIDRLFNTLHDNKAGDDRAAAKAEQERVDAEARGVALRLSASRRDPTDAEREALAKSTNGTAVYARFFEGNANRTSREGEGDKNRRAHELISAEHRRDVLNGALRTATMDEVKGHLAHARQDLQMWMDEHKGDYLDSAAMEKDPTYKALKGAVDDTQTAVENRAREGKDSIEETLRTLLRGEGPGAAAADAIPPEALARIPASFATKAEAKAWLDAHPGGNPAKRALLEDEVTRRVKAR